MANVYERIYKKLDKLTGSLENFMKDGGHKRIDNAPYMMLCIEAIGPNELSLAHYYEQNGDLVADPEMTIRIIPDMKMAEALTFSMPGVGIHKTVYVERDGKTLFYPKEKSGQNSFLDKWLVNLRHQGFYN